MVGDCFKLPEAFVGGWLEASASCSDGMNPEDCKNSCAEVPKNGQLEKCL